uniref:Armadillo segment polarity protein n=1 Tax=Aceria tosichella TaxID=561515 RepID=A0A6G1S9S3_9ACAR
MYFQQSSPYYDQTADIYNRGGGPAEGYLGDISNQLRQTSNQRVAAAMYPESIDNSTQILSTQYDGHQTAVQKLAEPSQMLVHAVVNLINYQDDADLATRALPELIKLLNDEDQVVMSQAAMVVHQLSKKQASRYALCNSASLVKALLQTLERSNDLETTKYTSEVLQSLSQNQQGLLAIFKTGGIRALIHALSSPIDSVVSNALTTIHNLLLHQEGAKMTVRLNGGLQKLVNLLQRDNPKFLAIVADCLHLLAYGSQEGKLIILASGGPAELVRILHSYNYEKLLFTTTRVIKVLSVCPSNKPALIQAGGMQALALCLNHQSKRLVQECLWALRNLSDGATKEMNLEPLIQRLLQLLEGSDINLVTCAAGTISNLTCNNPNNKNFACKVGAIQTLIQTIRNAGDRDEITEPAVCALRHLTNSHPEAEIAQEAVRIHGGLPDISKLLDPPSKWPILTATSGLVRNLASNQQNISALHELGIVQKLALLLNKAYQALQESSEESAGLAGIKIERVIESVVGALQAMATDYQSRIAIGAMNILTTLISLLYNDNEKIVLVSLDLLAELAREPEITTAIESQGGLPILTGLLSSPSEALRQRAGLLFSLVSGDKTPEYTQRLSNEINTLFQSEANDGSHWIAAPNQDLPSVYTIEGQLHAAPSLHSGGSRQQNEPWFDTDL